LVPTAGSMACIYCGGAPGGSGGGATTGGPPAHSSRPRPAARARTGPGRGLRRWRPSCRETRPKPIPLIPAAMPNAWSKANFNLSQRPNQPCVDSKEIVANKRADFPIETCWMTAITLGFTRWHLSTAARQTATPSIPGWQWSRARKKPCTPICGGQQNFEGNEMCDDGNTLNDDGCSSTCQVEPGGRLPHPRPAFANVGNSVETESRRRANPATAAPTRRKLPTGLHGPERPVSTATATGCSKNLHQGTDLAEETGTGPGRPHACATSCGKWQPRSQGEDV